MTDTITKLEAFLIAALQHQKAARLCQHAYDMSMNRDSFRNDAPALAARVEASEACAAADGGRILVMASNAGAIIAYAIAAEVHEQVMQAYRRAGR